MVCSLLIIYMCLRLCWILFVTRIWCVHISLDVSRWNEFFFLKNIMYKKNITILFLIEGPSMGGRTNLKKVPSLLISPIIKASAREVNKHVMQILFQCGSIAWSNSLNISTQAKKFSILYVHVYALIKNQEVGAVA